MVSTGYCPIYPTRTGAVEPFVYELSKTLVPENSVDVFGIGKGEETIEKVHVKTFPYPEVIPSSLSQIFGSRIAYQVPYNACLLKNILDLNKKNRIDIIHIHDANSGFASTASKLTINVPCVCSIHNEIRAAITLRSCDKILAVSEYIRDFLIHKRKLSPNRVGILDVAIDVEAFTATRSIEQAKKDLGLENHKVVLYVGRKCPEKGPQVLIESFQKIVSHNPEVLAILIGPDYSFMATSKSCSYTNFLTEKAKKLGVNENVIFKSFVPTDMLKLFYTAADVCVFPSIWQDPCPTVIKEALAYKKPVVSSNVGGIPHIVKNGFNGLPSSPK